MEYYLGREDPWKEFGASEEQWKDWRWQRSNVITSPQELSGYIDLSDSQIGMIENTIKSGKPMRITPYYTSLMGRNPTSVEGGLSIGYNVNGVFLQAVPTPDMYLMKAGTPDPMSEGSRSAGAFYQRYVDRGALMSSPSGQCHMFCTHCQRGKDQGNEAVQKGIDEGVEYIRRNENISEVLITGGDALAISGRKLESILKSLSGIGHVESVRIASRLPVTNPFASDPERLEMIGRYSKHTGGSSDLPNIYFATHANSPEELTFEMQEGVSRIRRAGFDIRNQTVLLKGVNDDFKKMSRMFMDMHHMGINPRYIFQCHKVDGLASKIVPINVGQYIMSDLRGQEGSSIPTYAVNMTGGGGKVVLTPQSDFGMQDFGYRLLRNMRTWKNDVVGYEELMRVRESDYVKALYAMSEFYGDSSILDSSEHDMMEEMFYSDDKPIDIGRMANAKDIKVRESASGKYRPSVIVVSDNDPDDILYVTNVSTPEIMTFDNKADALGYRRNGEELGFRGQPYVTNPQGFSPDYAAVREPDFTLSV
ncbi:MAG: KamA family radical SAM protein [Candidatus Aenigmarchaeota archaeon]|nr:KamA family radical SAM protein [Candidatus Aenigmarchaeota archaeon]